MTSIHTLPPCGPTEWKQYLSRTQTHLGMLYGPGRCHHGFCKPNDRPLQEMSPASRFMSLQILSPYFLQSSLSKTENLSTPHRCPCEQFIHEVIDSKHVNDLLDTLLNMEDIFFFPHETPSCVGEIGVNYMITDIISHFSPPAYGIRLKLLNIMYDSAICHYLAPNSFHPCL